MSAKQNFWRILIGGGSPQRVAEGPTGAFAGSRIRYGTTQRRRCALVLLSPEPDTVRRIRDAYPLPTEGLHPSGTPRRRTFISPSGLHSCQTLRTPLGYLALACSPFRAKGEGLAPRPYLPPPNKKSSLCDKGFTHQARLVSYMLTLGSLKLEVTRSIFFI